ncbi:hypothetical protein L3Q82_003286 [Scortum barcoo]|uniref:Uncharacterized protein n=1 Tax=Scortum barcoo TaxID=214431 RepID=A0ACB8VLW3_9TELE|nr:hypothetical protein L3Q82_003286 [Scortum barcoo]
MLQAETSNTEEQMEALLGGFASFACLTSSLYSTVCAAFMQRRPSGMSLMIQVAGLLKTTAKDFNVVALVTNHVTRSGGGKVQPGLGVSWSHIPRTRILLERVEKAATVGRSSRRSATLIKSSRQFSIQHHRMPSKLVTKLRDLGLNSALCDWILNFLTGADPRLCGWAAPHPPP